MTACLASLNLDYLRLNWIEKSKILLPCRSCHDLNWPSPWTRVLRPMSPDSLDVGIGIAGECCCCAEVVMTTMTMTMLCLYWMLRRGIVSGTAAL